MISVPFRRAARVAIPAVAAVAIVAGVVRAQTGPASPPAPPPMQPDGRAMMHEHHGWGGPMGIGELPALRLADRLSTMQTYLGITPAQSDAWRAFSNAAIAMAPDPEAIRREMDNTGAFDALGKMTEHVQQAAQKAQALDQAAHLLKAVLTPDQIQRADAAWTAMRAMHAHRMEGWLHRRWEDRDRRG